MAKPQEMAFQKVSMLRGSDFTRSLLGKSIHLQYDDAACVRQPECKPLDLLRREHKTYFRMGVFVELVFGIGVKGVVRLYGLVLRLDADPFV